MSKRMAFVALSAASAALAACGVLIGIDDLPAPRGLSDGSVTDSPMLADASVTDGAMLADGRVTDSTMSVDGTTDAGGSAKDASVTPDAADAAPDASCGPSPAPNANCGGQFTTPCLYNGMLTCQISAAYCTQNLVPQGLPVCTSKADCGGQQCCVNATPIPNKCSASIGVWVSSCKGACSVFDSPICKTDADCTLPKHCIPTVSSSPSLTFGLCL